MSSRAPWVVVGCYGSDGGGSGHGRCGHHMYSPIKKVSRVKKKKKLTRGSCILIWCYRSGGGGSGDGHCGRAMVVIVVIMVMVIVVAIHIVL